MDYDSWKLDTPDNHLKVCGECSYCESEIYVGQEYLWTRIGNFCNGVCFNDYMRNYYSAKHKIGEE